MPKLKKLSEEEIIQAAKKHLDKAGAYAAQDEGFNPAAEIRGCYLNVVGLPLCDVIDNMVDMGVKARLKSSWTPPNRCRECPLRRAPEVVAP